ncbi:hypothetical protein ELE36_03065 [Pseudolysobacter antarcticus]|uniref:TolC family protein n=1 Tax=Pseudolysobacter antarcticus TaxID=2511995 RepID=A0A411HG00_9GAMM|nr:hypothetical protein ELE36_03065 [Pseudolysobacter antarcticus]
MPHLFFALSRRVRFWIQRRYISHLSASIFLLWLAAASASEATPLSLDEAVQLAGIHAPTLDARQAAVESAEHTVLPAGQLPDPELVFGIDSLPVTTDERFSLTRDNFTERKIGLMQTFTRPEKRRLRSERAEAGAARERALLTTEHLTLNEAVARAWITRKTAERRLVLLHSLQARAQTQIDAATAALSAGRGASADAIAATAAKAMLEDRISEGERDLETANAELARWLPDAQDRPLGDAPDWSNLGSNPDALLTNIAHHRELLAYDAAEQAATAEVDLARAEKTPDWSVEFDYAQRGPRYSNFITVQLRVPLPIFAASRQDPIIASKQAAVAQITAERTAAQRMHTAELRKTLAAWRSAKDRVHRYETELLPLADDRADAALAAYRGGRGDLQASLSALDQMVEQRLVYTDLLNTLGQSWAALHFAFPQEH